MNSSGAKRKVKAKLDEASQQQERNADQPHTMNVLPSLTITSSHHRAETMAAINTALLQATDEASVLAAVAEYADAQGAAGVLLNYAISGENISSADFTPVARWIFKHPFPYRVIDGSEKFHDIIIEIRDLALQTPGNILYVEDIATDERFSPEKRADFLTQYPMRSEAMLGLYSGGRWQGSLIIMWHQPHTFTDDERYVYEQIVQNLSAVVATRRAYMAEQEAREEATTLYKVSEAVNAAKTYDELLRAVAVLEPQADTLYLYLWENYDFETATDYEVTAIYNMQGKSPVAVGHRLQKRDFPFSGKKYPERYWFIEDTHTDPEVDAVSRTSWDALNSRAILMVRLVYGEVRIGSIAFHSAEPRSFSERKRRLALAIGDLVTAAVERIRLAQNIQAAVEAQGQAYLAEQSAREEMSLLYQASEAINTASTFGEVIKAIAPLARQIERIYLFLWEHLDYRKASYFEIVAGINQTSNAALPVGMRFTEAQFPIAPHVVKARQVAIEDINNHPLVDPVTRAGWETSNARALLLVALVQKQRWYGTISFESSTPQKYSERDRRLTLAISDLVASAVIRIQAQQETAAAHAESAFLYQLAGEINAAMTYQEMVDSVARLQPDSSGVFLSFFEHLDLKLATYSETIAYSAISDQLKPHIKYRVPVVSAIEKLQHDSVWVSEDFFADPRFDEAARDYYRNLPVRASIVIPLRAGERLWGMMTFYYPVPRLFSEQERRIAMGIGDLASAAVERIRLQRETIVAKEEADFLYQLAEQINGATSYQSILDAVVRLLPDSEGLFLNLCENFDFDNGTYFEVPVGANVPERFQWIIGTRIPKANFPFTESVRNERLVVVNDVQTDPRIDAVSRASWETIGTQALMGVLFHREGRLLGWLLFVRSQPHAFTEHDRRLAMGIGDLAKAAVERIHLQQETIESKEEADFLYQLAEQINAATSYQSILDAVVRLLPDSEGVYLNLFEHLDIDRASYFEIPVAANIPENLQYIVGMRIPKSKFPLAEHLRDERLFVIEDVEKDTIADEVSRANWKVTGTQALVIVTLHREGRLFGWLFFNKSQPYHFPERDLRLLLGIGDLAKAAIERIGLQHETIVAKEEADFLYQLAEQINAATTYQAILDAVVRLLPDCEGVYLNLFEHFDYDRASYMEVPVAANIPDHLRWMVGQRIPMSRLQVPAELRNQRLLVIEDVRNDPRVDDVLRESWENTGSRALVIVTFQREGRLLGWLYFHKSQPYHFPERDLRLILGIGDLAKAAVERIHLQQETITARHQAETLANLNAAFSRAINEVDLLRAFVPYANSIGAYRVEMTYADHIRGDDPFASNPIALWESGEYTDYRQSSQHLKHVPSKQYLLGSLWLDQPDQVMYSPDIGTDSRLDKVRRTWMKNQFTMGAAVVLPLMHAGEFQGLISINWREAHVFSEDERYILERLLQTLPAVIATRRIYLSEQEARAENELLYTVGKDINRAKIDLEVMEAVKRCFPEPLYVAIFMWENYDRNKATFTETVISTDPGLPAGTRLPRDVFDLSTTVTGKVQVIHDVNAPEWANDAAADSARRFGIMSVAITSLIENQRVVGVFAVGCKTQRNFTDREIRLMSGVTELTGAALERFRLRDETEQARQRAHDLAALEERTRLARELHDSVSQALYGIGLGAQTAYRSLDKNPTMVRESIEYVLTLAEAGLAEMRALIFELRPESLETEGLAVALAKQAASIQARHGIEVQIELGDEPQMILATKESLYRVAREALHNVVKHASASKIMLRMRSEKNILQVDVIDNGIGFETSKDFPGHLGLHSMRERVMQMGGQISIKSAKDSGTQLSVTLPL